MTNSEQIKANTARIEAVSDLLQNKAAGGGQLNAEQLASLVEDSETIVHMVSEDGSKVSFHLGAEQVAKIEQSLKLPKTYQGFSIVGLDSSNEQTFFKLGGGLVVNNGFLSTVSVDYSEILLSKVFPVGSIYINASDVSPASFLGGTWTQIKDKFLLASGNTYSVGGTGGSADAVVVSHKHTLSYVYGVELGTFDAIPPMVAQGGTVVTDQTGFAVGTTGEDGTGKNMPPYVVVSVWKRVL